MIIDRRALTGSAALLGASASIGPVLAPPDDRFDEGAAVQRVFGADGRLVQVHASTAPGAPWVSLLDND
ncbi:MAG: hypothetical protein ACREH4_11300 [Vitreimonas sp.]